MVILKSREIKKIVSGTNTEDGAGVKLQRVLSRNTVVHFDPFLLLDSFDSDDPKDYTQGFPWHPHRGIETVTYIIEGNVEHGDSLGNKGTIENGGCQWMTAGGGILHQEMPQPSNKMLGVQLWLNLPAKEKMTTPKYRDITADMVPVIKEDNAEIKVISGNYNNQPGAMEADYVKMSLLDVKLNKNKTWEWQPPEKDRVFIFTVKGSGKFSDETKEINQKNAVLFEDDGEKLSVKASNGELRFLVFSGQPLKEPVAWGGPIVMNTTEELNQAFADIDNDQFVMEPEKRI
ncbi:MAG: pirin family protein [Halarsenatibacteraceae bacterium]